MLFYCQTLFTPSLLERVYCGKRSIRNASFSTIIPITSDLSYQSITPLVEPQMKFSRPKSQTITREGHIIFHITKKAEHAFILDLEDDKTTETERKNKQPSRK